MDRPCLFLTLLFAVAFPLRAQYAVGNTPQFQLSDRFTQAVEWQGQLVLANEYGMVLRDLSDLSGRINSVEKVAGPVGELVVDGQRLFVTVTGEADAGFHLYGTALGSRKPRWIGFQSVPGLKTMTIHKNFVIAVLLDKILIMKKANSQQYVTVSELRASAVKAVAVGGLVFLQVGGSVQKFLLRNDGSVGPLTPLSLLDSEIVSDLHRQGDRILFDSSGRIRWARFDEAGNLRASGLFEGSHSEGFVLRSLSSDSHLYLLFGDRLEAYLVESNDQLRRVGSLAISYSELTKTQFVPVNGRLHLLNLEKSNRGWSFRTYVADGIDLVKRAEVASVLGEISFVTSSGEKLYVASGNGLFDAGFVESSFPAELKEIFRFENEPVSFAAGNDEFFAVLRKGTSNTLQRLRFTSPSTVLVDFRKDYEGSLSDLVYYNGSLSFVQRIAGTSKVQYIAHVLIEEPDLEMGDYSMEKTFFQAAKNPFLNLQITPAGLLHRDAESVYLHSNLRRLQETQIQHFLPENQDVLAIHALGDRYLVETSAGLHTAELKNNRLAFLGYYPQWWQLQRVGSRSALARCRMERLPNRQFLLSLDENQKLISELHFDGAQAEAQLIFTEKRIVHWDKTHLQSMAVEEPAHAYLYPIPMVEGQPISLELANLAGIASMGQKNFQNGAGRIAVIQIYNREGARIGRQLLTESLIGKLSGAKLESWLFDYDHTDVPASAVLESSVTIDPVLSGIMNGKSESLFAVELAPAQSSQLLLPHIPRDLGLWRTSLFVRESDGQGESAGPLVFLSPLGTTFVDTMTSGVTHQLELGEATPSWPGPWGTISSPDLSKGLSGFALYSRVESLQTSAIQLGNNEHTRLYLPFVIGNYMNVGWTGVVISNTHSSKISLRIVGYAADGTPVLSTAREIAGSETGVYMMEALIEAQAPSQPISYVIFDAEVPIQGIALYGNSLNGNLAGVTLSGASSQNLRLSGIRANSPWLTQILLTNLQTGEGSVTLEAYDSFGHLIASAIEKLPSQGNLFKNVAQIFPNLEAQDRAQVQTITARANKDMTGIYFRAQSNAPGWSAVSAQPYLPGKK